MTLDTGRKIVQLLTEGGTPIGIQRQLNLSASIFQARFEEIREAAGLPKEKRAYQACKDQVMSNLEDLDSFQQDQALANARYRDSLNKFSF